MASKPPALIMPDGRPLVRDQLDREIAKPSRASIRTIQSGHPAQGLTPERLAQLLLSAEQGDAIAYYELAEEMEEKDLHYLGVLRTRKLAVTEIPMEVEPADKTPQAKEDAALVEKWLDRDMLQAELLDILDAIGKEVSATELIWDLKPKSWLPKAIKWRDPRWFEFDKDTGEELLLRGGADGIGMPTQLPAGKFIVHHHPSKSGLPVRSGLARIVAWGYMFKNFAMKDWVTFLERYGHPLRIGKYGPNESEENKNILYRALWELGTDAAAAFPETMQVDFVDRKAGTAPNDLWKSHIEYIDFQVSKAVLGQTSTTDAVAGGLGSGQADSHKDVAKTIQNADGRLLAATLNRDLVVPLVMFNRGPREAYPRIKIEWPKQEDIKTSVETAQKLAGMGVKIDGEEMRERARLPAAKNDDTALKPEGAAMVPADGATGDAPAGDAGAKIQQLALNGAQVQSLSQMVQAVAAGEVSKETARALIAIAFPAVTTEQIENLLRDVDEVDTGSSKNPPQDGAGAQSGGAGADKGGKGFLRPLKSTTGANGNETGTLQAQQDREPEREPDALALTTDEALGDWEPMIAPLLDPVDALIGDCETLGELQSRLAEAMAGMDPEAFTEELARGLFAARVSGQADRGASRDSGG